MNAVDLFAGGGGWDVAAEALGLVPLGIEWNADACATGEAAGHLRLQRDIATLEPRHQAPGGLDLLIASPPCQAFSAAGKGKGRAHKSTILDGVTMLANARTPRDRADVCATIDAWITEDDRASLVLEPLRWALDLMPATLAWEQVPAVLPVWQACAEVLRSRGYTVDCGYLTAEQYDVPQTRKRAILVASRAHHVQLPAPRRRKYRKGVAQHQWLPGQERLLPWISMADALGWGMTARPSMTVTGGGTGSGGAEPFGNMARQGIRRQAEAGLWMAQAGATSTMVDPRPVDTPATAAWVHERPATTLTGRNQVARPHNGGKGESMNGSAPTSEGHGSVRVTVEEAATLQGFPTGYPWRGNKTAQYRQVGDAVPPPLAWHVLRAALGMPATAWPGLDGEAAA